MISKGKRSIYYAGFVCLIIASIYIAFRILQHSEIKEYIAVNRFTFTVFIITFSIYFTIGAIVGLESLVRQLFKKGKMKYDFIRALILGLPLLVLSITSNLLTFYKGEIPLLLYRLMIFSSHYRVIFVMLFGFVIVSSFYRNTDV